MHFQLFDLINLSFSEPLTSFHHEIFLRWARWLHPAARFDQFYSLYISINLYNAENLLHTSKQLSYLQQIATNTIYVTWRLTHATAEKAVSIPSWRISISRSFPLRQLLISSFETQIAFSVVPSRHRTVADWKQTSKFPSKEKFSSPTQKLYK